MEFIKEEYKLTLEKDYEGEININLFNGDVDSTPLMYLKLKPLSEIDTEFDDQGVIRDIPRDLFNEGDYFQSSVTKYNKTDKYKNISLLALIHDFLLENNTEFIYLKRLFSSSLKNYQEEVFMTEEAKNFWFLQMNKKPNIPISYFKKDRRFLITINQ